MNNQQIAKIVEMLENARKRPNMYIGKVEVEVVEAWIAGFNMAVEMLDAIAFQSKSRFWCPVVEDRGWQVNALGCTPQMLKKGMTTPDIVDELLAIEIEMWKRAAQQDSTQEPANDV